MIIYLLIHNIIPDIYHDVMNSSNHKQNWLKPCCIICFSCYLSVLYVNLLEYNIAPNNKVIQAYKCMLYPLTAVISKIHGIISLNTLDSCEFIFQDIY